MKNKPTPKQNKWNDPFYSKARFDAGGKNFDWWRKMRKKRSPFKVRRPK